MASFTLRRFGSKGLGCHQEDEFELWPIYISSKTDFDLTESQWVNSIGQIVYSVRFAWVTQLIDLSWADFPSFKNCYWPYGPTDEQSGWPKHPSKLQKSIAGKKMHENLPSWCWLYLLNQATMLSLNQFTENKNGNTEQMQASFLVWQQDPCT